MISALEQRPPSKSHNLPLRAYLFPGAVYVTGSETDLNIAGETYFAFNKAVQGGTPDTGVGVLTRTLLVFCIFSLRFMQKRRGTVGPTNNTWGCAVEGKTEIN